MTQFWQVFQAIGSLNSLLSLVEGPCNPACVELDSAIGGSLSSIDWSDEFAVEAGILTGELEKAAAEMEVNVVA